MQVVDPFGAFSVLGSHGFLRHCERLDATTTELPAMLLQGPDLSRDTGGVPKYLHEMSTACMEFSRAGYPSISSNTICSL